MNKYKVTVSAVVLMDVEVEVRNREEAIKKTNKGDYEEKKIVDTHSLEIQGVREI